MTTRRDFLTAMGASLVAACASSKRSVVPTAPDPAASTIAIDMHNHVYPTGTEPHRGGEHRDAAPSLALDDALQRSGLTAVCASFVLDFAANEKPGDARASLLRWLDAIDAELAAGRLRRALTAADLRAAHAHARPTIVQTVEGSMFIEGELERIDEVYRRGLRHLQLFHEADDRVSPLGDVNTRAPHLGGLTAFGAEVIRACNRLGVVVDLAHASHETVIGALAASAQPLVVSHTSLDSWGSESKMYSMMKPRLITKAQAKAVADGGGVIGVWTHLTRSRADYVGSIRAMVDAIGIDHVGIGTDTDLLAARGGTNDRWPDEHGFFAGVVDEMGRQGFGAEDIAKVGGGNYVRVFEQVTSPART